MTAAEFRRIALIFDGAEEGSHMGAVDFRVGGHIFATLASIARGFGNLMLTPEIQRSSSQTRRTYSSRLLVDGVGWAPHTFGWPRRVVMS